MNTAVKIRSASEKDINEIYNLIRYYAGKDLILERSHDDIRSNLDNFFVAEKDNTVIGIISYYDYGPQLKEIRSLGVKMKYSKNGIGSLLVEKIKDHLHLQGRPRIFVLTKSVDFFIKNGFSVILKETLPEKIWKDCQNCKHEEWCDETAMIYRV